MRDVSMPAFHSNVRYEAAKDLLENANISKQDLLELLKRPVPTGLFAPHYSSGFGTLRAHLFDLSSMRADICFGDGQNGYWREASLHGPAGLSTEYVKVYDEAAPASFWQPVNPDEMVV